MEALINRLARLAHKGEDYIETLKGENGEWLPEEELTERLIGDISEQQRIERQNQYKRGVKEKGIKYDKMIREAFPGVPEELRDTSIIDFLRSSSSSELSDEGKKWKEEAFKYRQQVEDANRRNKQMAIRSKINELVNSLNVIVETPQTPRQVRMNALYNAPALDPENFELDEKGNLYPVDEKGYPLPGANGTMTFADVFKENNPFGYHAKGGSQSSKTPGQKAGPSITHSFGSRAEFITKYQEATGNKELRAKMVADFKKQEPYMKE